MATIDTIADRSTGSAVAGKAYFETSTNKFIVYSGSAWIEIDSDGTGEVPFENRWGANIDSSGRLEVASTSDFTFGTGDFTVSTWFKTSSTSFQCALWDFRTTAVTNRKWPMVWLTHNGINVHIDDYITQPSYSTIAGQWRHLVVSRSGDQLSVYLDDLNTPLSTVTSTENIDSTNLTIGTYVGNTASGSIFPGFIDNFSVFNSTSSLSSVSDLASSSKPVDLSSYNPVAWYRMGDDSNDSASDGGSIATVTDSSGNGNDATQGTASLQPTWSDLTGETIYA